MGRIKDGWLSAARCCVICELRSSPRPFQIQNDSLWKAFPMQGSE